MHKLIGYVLPVGTTVDEAIYFFSALERLCKVQLLAEAAEANGIPKTLISNEDAEFTAKTIQWWENVYVNVSFIKISATVIGLTCFEIVPTRIQAADAGD